jgi:hypothetical protein
MSTVFTNQNIFQNSVLLPDKNKYFRVTEMSILARMQENTHGNNHGADAQGTAFKRML